MTTNSLTVTLASGDPLDVRDFAVDEGLSRLFDVTLTAMSSSVDVDFEGAIGQTARFEILRTSAVDGETRYWSGICIHAELVAVEDTGLSTYTIRIVPTMWLLTQRRNYRIFQDQSELDIVLAVLSGWGIQPTQNLDASSYPKRRMRTQYAETDFDFVNRLLEDIGVTYYFEQTGGDTTLVLSDAPNKGSQRAPVPFVSKPTMRLDTEFVTAVRTRREVRPGRYTQSDVDYRKALNYPLASSASQGNATEAKLERYHHNYGSFLWKADPGGNTPVADDRGAARTDETQGATQVNKRLQAQRIDARVCTFVTTAHDLRPGKVFTITGHPRDEIGAPLLIASAHFRGSTVGEWHHLCETRYTDVDYRPPLNTPKPRTNGVESATVTGPAGEQIHTDEFGRVRVHFHWDREGADDETSSCWIPVNQPWAGAGFGAINLCRVGQEVLVDFLGADPDRPVAIGRVYTLTTPPPYQLPQYKMTSGMRSNSYPEAPNAAPQNTLGGGLPAMDPAGGGVRAPPWLVGVPPGPAGGGMPVGQLGAGAAAPAAPPADLGGRTGNNMPGATGGPKAKSLNPMVDNHGSKIVGTSDPNLAANALILHDQAGAEALYIQGQNELYTSVKRNQIGTVGANRIHSVHGNDTETVRGYQQTLVGAAREVGVGGLQGHVVVGDIIVQGLQNHLVVTEKSYTNTATTGSQAFDAKTGILLRVDGGKSTILMTPTAIVIDSAKVYINPGETFMNVVNSGGSTDAAEEASKKAEEAKQAAAERQKRIDSIAGFMQQKAGDADRATSLATLKAMSEGRFEPGVAPGINNLGYTESNVGNPDVQAAAGQTYTKMGGT